MEPKKKKYTTIANCNPNLYVASYIDCDGIYEIEMKPVAGFVILEYESSHGEMTFISTPLIANEAMSFNDNAIIYDMTTQYWYSTDWSGTGLKELGEAFESMLSMKKVA